MPVTYPLSYADFLGALPIQSITMECPEVVEASQTAGAEVLTSAIGNRYWQGEVTLGRMQRHEKRDAQVLIDVARNAGASFFMTDVTQPYPLTDEGGVAVAGSAPKIVSLPSDARQMGLLGLPANFVLRRGDYLSFAYRSNPVRYALHRVVDQTVTASPTGVTQNFEVLPPLQPGAALTAPVQLIRPFCKAVIIPGSVQPGRTTRFITEGMSFRFIQTLR